MKLVSLLLLMFSCATNNVPNRAEVKAESEKIEKKEAFKYSHQKITAFNGKIKFVSIPTKLKTGKHHISCKWNKRKVEYPGYVSDGVFEFYLGLNYFSRSHTKKCYLDKNHVLTVKVRQFKYKREKLNVPKKRVDLNKKDLARVIREKEIKKRIYDDSSDNFLFNKEFVIPLKSKITSVYGNQRIFNNKKKAQHLGNDLRAAVGVKIPAINRGRVVFTGDLFFSGNIVVIDHGLELFTVYMHLSKILVQKGDIVNQGDIVGLAGMTGRVSGPHLHWGVRINGHWVDGFTLVSESKQQFSGM